MFNKNEKYAYDRGYRMDKDGLFFNPKGEVICGYKHNGYRKYKLRVPGDYNKYFYFKLSRFQAYCKFGDKIYNKGMVVRHLNGIRNDDSWDNIEIGTQSENMMDCPKEDRIARAINASRKIVKHNVKEIRDYYSKVKSYRKTMKKFNISSSGTLWYILHRPNIH